MKFNPKGVATSNGVPHASVSFRCLYPFGFFHKTSTSLFTRCRLAKRPALFPWGNFENLGVPSSYCGRVEDHVHLLARFGRTITQAEWVKELKRVSNLWVKENSGISNFEWQGGYADFSVSHSNLEQVKSYIANQEEHHRKLSFQDEVRALLTKHQMDWDERYIWD